MWEATLSATGTGGSPSRRWFSDLQQTYQNTPHSALVRKLRKCSMTALLEDPTPIILFGIVAEAVLGVILLRTGRAVLLWAMAGVLVLVLAGIGLEQLMETDREQVEATLDRAVAAVAANDRDGLLVHIHSSASEARRLVNWGFGQANFTDAKITHVEILPINYLINPPRAEVRINGIVDFKLRRGETPYPRRPINMTLKLQRESDRWLIIDEVEWANDPRG